MVHTQLHGTQQPPILLSVCGGTRSGLHPTIHPSIFYISVLFRVKGEAGVNPRGHQGRAASHPGQSITGSQTHRELHTKGPAGGAGDQTGDLPARRQSPNTEVT